MFDGDEMSLVAFGHDRAGRRGSECGWIAKVSRQVNDFLHAGSGQDGLQVLAYSSSDGRFIIACNLCCNWVRSGSGAIAMALR